MVTPSAHGKPVFISSHLPRGKILFADNGIYINADDAKRFIRRARRKLARAGRRRRQAVPVARVDFFEAIGVLERVPTREFAKVPW